MKAIMIRCTFLCAVLATATWLSAGDKEKKTPEKMEPKVVDSGSFSIYVGGKRIGSETFKIEQRPDFHIATAEVKVDDGTTKATQTAELQVTPTGDLHSYVWHAASPLKEEVSVLPNEQTLIEHIIPADTRKMDLPHSLPLSTAILDDNFFSQREVLLWRYLATGCGLENQGLRCGPGSFVVLVPRQHVAVNATLSVVGPDKLAVKGTVREVTKISLQIGDPQRLIVLNSDKESPPGIWLFWVDDQYKIMKISVAGSNVEVVRD